MRLVRNSDALRAAARDLAARAIDFWSILDAHRSEMARPMERAGRKAQPLGTREGVPT